MENNTKINERSPPNSHAKKSSFIAEIEIERNLRIANLQTSSKKLSYSTYLDLKQIQVPITPSTEQFLPKHKDLMQSNLEVIRARSLKNIADHKPILQAAEKATNEFNESMIHLKVQQMTFKYKTKISCLLKQLNVSAHDMIRFNNISKAEEIINFLSLKIREKITKSQNTQENYIKARSKSKQAVKQHEIQIEILRRKMIQKQNTQKDLKFRLRDSQAQARELLNTINQKEKELSLRMDQLYQQKMTINQQQKLITRLQTNSQQLQLQNQNIVKKLNNESNCIVNRNKQLEQKNTEFILMVEQFKEEIEQYKEKQNKLLDLNRQLNEEVNRWRQRYDDGPQSENEKYRTQTAEEVNSPLTPSVPLMKKSTMSMNNLGFANFQIGNSKKFLSSPAQIQNMRLITKIQYLQKKNKQLMRYYDLTIVIDENQAQKYKQKPVNKNTADLEIYYQKKIEVVAKSWKQKLYELVNKYEDQLQQLKQQIDKLQRQKEEIQKRIINLANEKYLVQTRLTEKQGEVYDLTKILSINRIYYKSKTEKQQNHSNSIIISESQIKMFEFSQVKELSNQIPQTQKEQNLDKVQVQTKQNVSL